MSDIAELIDTKHPLVGVYKTAHGGQAIITHAYNGFLRGYYVGNHESPANPAPARWGMDGVLLSVDRQSHNLVMPLTIEVGKYYRTRSGDVACVCFKDSGYLKGVVKTFDCSDVEVYVWLSDGRSYTDETVHDFDLIAEVTPDGDDMP